MNNNIVLICASEATALLSIAGIETIVANKNEVLPLIKEVERKYKLILIDDTFSTIISPIKAIYDEMAYPILLEISTTSINEYSEVLELIEKVIGFSIL